MKQTHALNILKTGQNVFLTGSAGSGKTYTLNQYIHYLRARRVPVAITASTGIAATHMNGITIHSWSGIGIKSTLTDKDLNRLSGNKKYKERLKTAAVLIIDEISMLHAKQLDAVNQVLQFVRQSADAFGGMQVVLAGDFYQLPPIGTKEESNRDKFAFMSKAWLEANFCVCYLTEQYRQTSSIPIKTDQTDSQTNIDTTSNNSNSASSSSVSLTSTHSHNDITTDANASLYPLSLNDILNQIRRSQVTNQAVDVLLSTANNHVHASRTRLYTHNFSVDRINTDELTKLDSQSMTFVGVDFGDAKLVDMMKKSVRTSDELTLKVGAKVMFVKNIADLDVFNGTMGEVIKFTDIEFDGTKDTFAVVRLNTGREVIATPEEWMVEDEQGTVLASYKQVPLCLAWAITVHKSQGMTLDAAEIDLSHTFEMGQGYVALSRLKDLNGLKLLGINETSLRLDPLARGADKRFIELSDELEIAQASLTTDELQEAHNEFVLSAGGTLNQQVIESYENSRKKRLAKQARQQNQEAKNSQPSIEITKTLLEASLSIAEISEQRELAQSTIMGHVSQLKALYPTLACEHLRPDEAVMDKVQQAYDAIHLANDPNDFNQDGQIKLRPLYEYMNEELAWNSIRLALIFIEPVPVDDVHT